MIKYKIKKKKSLEKKISIINNYKKEMIFFVERGRLCQNTKER